MSHSLNKIWLHQIYSTKDRYPLLRPDIEHKVYQHLKEQYRECGCYVKTINGMPDHIHCLIMQNPKMSVIETIKQVKGNTAHWINHENLIPEKFVWQTGYAAFSVSESQIDKVHNYILKQKEHHKKRTFKEEYDEFISAYGLLDEIQNG